MNEWKYYFTWSHMIVSFFEPGSTLYLWSYRVIKKCQLVMYFYLLLRQHPFHTMNVFSHTECLWFLISQTHPLLYSTFHPCRYAAESDLQNNNNNNNIHCPAVAQRSNLNPSPMPTCIFTASTFHPFLQDNILPWAYLIESYLRVTEQSSSGSKTVSWRERSRFISGA